MGWRSYIMAAFVCVGMAQSDSENAGSFQTDNGRAAATDAERLLEAQNIATGTWLEYVNWSCYHHSIEYDGYEHRTACGLTIEAGTSHMRVIMTAQELSPRANVCSNCLRVDAARIRRQQDTDS